jgi:hypothetical protein
MACAWFSLDAGTHRVRCFHQVFGLRTLPFPCGRYPLALIETICLGSMASGSAVDSQGSPSILECLPDWLEPLAGLGCWTIEHAS